MDSESGVSRGQLHAAGAIRPSLPWCFSVAEGSILGAGASRLELVSCGFRKWRYARPTAGRRRHMSFTAMVFQCGEGVRFGSLGELGSVREEGTRDIARR